MKYQVIVAGAGTAGVVAALQAARAGASTLLLERSGQPGGTMTSGRVDYPGLYHAWGKQVIAGIGWELTRAAALEAGQTLPDFTEWRRPHWELQVRINPFLLAAQMEEALAQAGVTCRYYATPAAVCETESGVTVTLADGGKESGELFIDATGNAEMVAMAGFGVLRRTEKQPATMILRFSNFDLADVDVPALENAYQEAMRTGELRRSDTGISGRMEVVLLTRGDNTMHIPLNPAPGVNPSQINQQGRLASLRLYRFLRRQKGLQNLSWDFMAPECGIRESAVIEGEYAVTIADYLSGRQWPDSLSYAYYPIDLHEDTERGLDNRKLTEGVVPTVPVRALRVKNSKRILGAGRILASDRLANSALRVQATCQATGQIAGALATVAAQAGTNLDGVDLAQVRELLKRHQAIVPGQ